MTRDTRLRDFGTAYWTTKRVIKEHAFFFIFFGEALTTTVQGFSISTLYRIETIAPKVVNEVVKKASSLTANGDPR